MNCISLFERQSARMSKIKNDRLAQSVDNSSDEYAVSITFFHLPATLLSFPEYVLPHLSLVQPHDPENFNHS